MKQTRMLMGMTINIEIVDAKDSNIFDKVFNYFIYIDNTFSTYKGNSEISKFNKGLITETDFSNDMKTVFKLSEDTKNETSGFFDIKKKDIVDPSGLVKGWAIYNAAQLVKKEGYNNFYIDAGGDIQASGVNAKGEKWKVGIKNPFNQKEIVKVIKISNEGVATSGTYIRGQHVYNPHDRDKEIADIVSLTVVGKNVYEADRFATAAFAMGKKGIEFIEQLKGFEGYMIDAKGIATFTSRFENYI